MVYASNDTKCKSSTIIVVNIWELMYKRVQKEEEATSHKPAEIETWWLHVRKAFADLIEPPTGIPPAWRNDNPIDTDLTVTPPHCQSYCMSDLECLEFKTQIAKLQATGCVTDSPCRFAAPDMMVNKPDGSGLQMSVNYRGLNATTTRDWYPLFRTLKVSLICLMVAECGRSSTMPVVSTSCIYTRVTGTAQHLSLWMASTYWWRCC